jgi:DNA (cytosine-5)-methyltransferase 1
MRFGSVCSGIEAASVAWHLLGWKAAWLSEIEPFPCAVLKHHYPDVPNLGDMTRLPELIGTGLLEAPDVFCGGTPCQAFSVAGLRNSLDDARGNLSLTFCEIANAIDNKRITAGMAPAIIFWENVPGVLSTKDNAFGCFLAGLAGEDNPLEPPRGKWTNSGYVFGPKRAVAWRLLDAQYFGLAQRRKRVFVVASARADFDPAAVLFEFDGVRRDTAPSREAGERIAPCVTNGPPFNRTGNERVECEAIIAMAHGQGGAEISFDRSPTLTCNHEAPIAAYEQPISIHPHCIGRAPNAGPQGKEYLLDGSAYCMDGRGQPQPIPINSMNALRNADADPSTGCGIGEAGEAMFTITKGHSHAVAQPISFGAQMSVPQVDFDLNQTLQAKNPMAVAWSMNLMSPGRQIREDDGVGALTQDAHRPTQGNEAVVIQQAMAVRRLTPVECERLQGFPDGYTNIPWRKKPEAPDGPRYKALGNSWAVPVVRWIGNRIQEAVRC